MGAVAVWIAEHAKMLIQWAALLVAIGVLTAAVYNSDAFSAISSSLSGAVSYLGRVASYIPDQVSAVNSAVAESVSESNGWGALMFWLAGLDVLQTILAFIAANISALCTGVVTVALAGAVLGNAVWVLKQFQRAMVSITMGKANGTQMVE